MVDIVSDKFEEWPAYALTQTLAPKHRHLDIKLQLGYLLYHLRQWLKPICSYYELWPELHQDGNVHIHGILFVKDKIKYYKTLKRHVEKVGFVTLKTIEDYMKWYDYCIKDRVDMCKTFGFALPIHKKRLENYDKWELAGLDTKIESGRLDEYLDLDPPL